MRRLTPVLLIVALAAAGYNYYQIDLMRKELHGMNKKLQVARSSQNSAADADLLVVLGKAREHSENARELMARGKTKRARAELDESLRLLDKASRLSRKNGAGDDYKVIQLWERVRTEAEKAWKDMASEAKNRGSK